MIDHLDHLVLTTTDPAGAIDFYTRVLGMQLERFGVTPELPQGRIAFRFGNQKINLHVKGAELEPKAHLPVPGALDLCFIAALPLESVIEFKRDVYTQALNELSPLIFKRGQELAEPVAAQVLPEQSP